jgi:glycosyltransferase involved in cell wall biosynthesis
MTDPLGQSQVIPYLAGLQQLGFNITILSCEKKEVYEKRKATVADTIAQSGLKWKPLMYTKKPPVLSTLFDIIQLKRTAKKIHLANRVDMVHTRPGIPSLVGFWLKQHYRVKFLNDIREFYADSRVDGDMWPQKNIIYKTIYHYFKRNEEKQVKGSDGIVCLTYAAEKIIKQWPVFNPNTPLQVIPCSVDLELFDPASISVEEKADLKKQLGIFPADKIFSYLGSIGGWYLTDEMMKLCKVISTQIPAARFLFISPHLHETITSAAAKQGLSSDKIITRQAARKEVPHLLSLSDYSVFFIKPCYSKLSSSPTKHGEIMAMGIPVITNDGVGDVKEIVEKYNGGYVVNEFTDDSYQAIAKTIVSKNSFNPQEIRNGAKEFYSLAEAIKRYHTIYNAILLK